MTQESQAQRVNTLDKFARLAALKSARAIPSKPAALRAPKEADVVANLLGAGVAQNHYGEHLAIRNWFSTPEFSEPSPVAIALLSRAHHGDRAMRTRNESAAIRMRAALEDPQKWLFLDTETTGLAGGTGTYAFLIGLAWWDAGGLQVEQFLMRDFAEEHSLLHELSLRLAERPVLITFNGKSFDWPLLESRFTMTRSIAVPKLAAHLDLLHPARAVWKLRLGSVRLTELERHALDSTRLGYRRDGDISSAMIPQYYFDYLRGGPAAPLAGVVKHNQMDLRGLAALYCKLNVLLTGENDDLNENGSAKENGSESGDLHERSGSQGIASLDLFGLSRFLQRRGDPHRAQSVCAQALEIGLPAEIRPRARRDLALLAKRRGEHARAAELWQEIVADPQDGIHACEQLAIYFELRVKDFSRAKEFAHLALAKLRQQRAGTRDPYAAARMARQEKQFQMRVARLQQRMKSSEGSTKTLLLARSQNA
jgi:uncharacterized protein YprB with RNaseH-like and TPR domain